VLFSGSSSSVHTFSPLVVNNGSVRFTEFADPTFESSNLQVSGGDLHLSGSSSWSFRDSDLSVSGGDFLCGDTSHFRLAGDTNVNIADGTWLAGPSSLILYDGKNDTPCDLTAESGICLHLGRAAGVLGADDMAAFIDGQVIYLRLTNPLTDDTYPAFLSGIREVSSANLACEAARAIDPNAGCEELSSAIAGTAVLFAPIFGVALGTN